MSKHEKEDDDSEDEKDSHAELPSDQSIEQQKCVEFHISDSEKDRESSDFNDMVCVDAKERESRS